jgi:hypothetical protein
MIILGPPSTIFPVAEIDNRALVVFRSTAGLLRRTPAPRAALESSTLILDNEVPPPAVSNFPAA